MYLEMCSLYIVGWVGLVVMVGSGGVDKSALTLQYMYDEVDNTCI